MRTVSVTDVLGEPWTAETIHFPPDDEGAVVATLVRRLAGDNPGRRAVLHVHGFADYFFQTEYAAWWLERGYDFYALDLRKCGRSLLAHQSPHFAHDLTDYFADLDSAWHRVTERDGHDHVVLSAHSTGGLTCSLWADERRPGLAGLVLNAPWLDMQGSTLLRTVGTVAVNRVGRRSPYRTVPRRVDGHYARSLHHEHEGEWQFDTELKPLTSFPVFAGWLRAVRQGHARLQRGLDVGCPVLVLSSSTTAFPKEMGDDVHQNDVVLDVEQIRRWSTSLGRHVTYVAVPGARHDVTLSLPEPRARVYDELERWRAAYVDR
jgi:alpha-beta hydrolase superfamily lysophospholipase